MVITPLEILNGTLSLVCVIVSIIVGLTIISRYLKYKQVNLILVGITWIGVFSPWWPSTISFLVALITGTGLTPTMYFFIGFFASPLVITVWIVAFTSFKFKKQQKVIVGIYLIIGIAFEIYLLFTLFVAIDPEQIGTLTGVCDTTYRGIAMYFSIFIVITMLVTGVLFGLASRKSENPEIRLKGMFLIIAFVSWVIGALLDAALPLDFISLTIARIILISSALEFYCGFLLPNIVKKIFLK